LQDYLRRLSFRAEFTIVVGLAFAPFILKSFREAFFPSTPTPITGAHLQNLLLYEPSMLLLIGSFLVVRGRSLAWLGSGPALRDPLFALGLAAAAWLSGILLWIPSAEVMDLSAALTRHARLVGPGIDNLTIVATSLVNAVFEEVLVAGYVITALKETRGLWFAVNTSAAIRVSYHLYQGSLGVITVLPLALIFGYWYARTSRMWPLIIAHAGIDIVSLVASQHIRH